MEWNNMTDFEELIDLNIYFPAYSQKSTQGPLNDVLDQMCEAMEERNLAMDDNINSNGNGISNNMKDPHENTDVNEIESITVPACIGDDSKDIDIKNKINDCSNTNTNELKYDNNRITEIITNDDIEEFESILAAKTLEMKDKTIENTTNNEDKVNEIVGNDDVIDLDEFEAILAANCFGNDCIGDESITNGIDDTNQHFGQIISNDILTNNYLEYSNLKEKVDEIYNTNVTNDEVIDLDKFVSQNLYLDKNNTGAENCNSKKYEINNIAPYEVPVELKVESDIKLVDAEICEEKDINSDSEDGYNSSDFECITEDEASKAGLITRFDKIAIDENKYTNNSAVKIPSDNIAISDSRKNEASPLDYRKYSKYSYRLCYAQRSPEHHANHAILQGERYLDLFRGQYAPIVMNNLIYMGNKNCVPSGSGLMTAGTEDPGVELLRRAPEDDENYKTYKGDADECRKKILATYPAENKRKKRRYSRYY